MSNDAGLTCPKCGAKVVMPSKARLFQGPPRYLHCNGCGAELQPIFCAEKRLVDYAFLGLYFLCFSLLWLSLKTWALPLLLGNILVGSPITQFVSTQIRKRCANGFKVVDTKVPENQFSLMDALYAMLVFAVLTAVLVHGYTGRKDEGWGLLWGAYILWGLIEFARYVSIRRSQGRIS